MANILDTKSIVSSAIKCVRVNTSEVTYTRQCQVYQAVQEFIHSLAAQCYLAADCHAFTELKVSNGLLCLEAK